MQLALVGSSQVSGICLTESGARATLFDGWPLNTRQFERLDVDPASPALTAYRIDQAVLSAERPVLLLAHAASCATAAWWAKLSPARYVARVAGAVFVEPAGRNDAAVPAGPLPFSSIVIGNDDHSQRQAAEWGSRLIDGPLPIAGAAPTSRLRATILRFTAAIVESDVETGRRLLEALGDR